MLYVVTGASGSGKSEYAENLAVKLSEGGALYYVATMKPFGEEGQERIHRHHALRKDKGFTTIECYTDIGQISDRIAGEAGGDCRRATVLLECVSNLLANEMFGEEESVQMKGGKAELSDKLLSEIDNLAGMCKHLVVVTNEVFSDGIRYAPETERYRKELARINRLLVERSDEAAEVIYTVPMDIKRTSTCGGERKMEGEDIYESLM